ncbi:hypothetical protein ACOCEA_14060 [Maribacter sp. CXY002]|uniref:hypothetical protein n=1 Tax=Maribacter luteocoastalis TaxID=3407671 RepID=UPI003B67FDD0
MKSNTTKYTYVEWLSAEEMHATSKLWLSELSFIIDEQLFLNDLVKSYSLQLAEPEIFDQSKKIISQIQKTEKEVGILIKKVKAHENELEIMVDQVDELKMEKAYIETHKELLNAMNTYTKEYRKAKKKLFIFISTIMKKEKQNRLLR